MRKKTKYTEGPFGRARLVTDFLPPPEQLAFREEGVKVTMVLSKSSVDYFKRVAKKFHTPYQKMIRTLIDSYASSHPRP